MPNGSSTLVAKSIDHVSLYVYVIEGAALMILNGLFALLIYTSKNLRQQKEYIIFAGFMIYDTLFGLMYFLAGIRRLQIYYGPDKYVEAYSRWECFLVFHTLLFIVNTPTSGIMSFLSCLDRFISVTFPIKYLKFTPTYGYCLTIITLLCSLPTAIIAGILDYMNKDIYDVHGLCVLQQGSPDFIPYVLRGIRIIATLVGILLYVCIAYKMYQLINPSRSDPNALSSVKRKKLMTMTVTFLLITLNQLFLFVAPDIYLLMNSSTNDFAIYVMNLNKGIVNIVIFLVTQKDLRRAIAKRLLLKQKATVQFLSEITKLPEGVRAPSQRKLNLKAIMKIK